MTHFDDTARTPKLDRSVALPDLEVAVRTSLASDAFDSLADSTLDTESVDLQIEPRTLSVRFGEPRIRTIGYSFPEVGMPTRITPRIVEDPDCADNGVATRTTSESKRSRIELSPSRESEHARISVPKDIVKLADRLFYVLQPPMDSWFQSHALQFPHDPFPYQLNGMAFMYPRVSAILADEMGLGKTMQAISTIRLLLRKGEVRSVLLICPKPLVSNWQREFLLWAPEIPVSVIGGNQATRKWQWMTSPTPVRIANYELLVRDELVITNDVGEFDLVVLDEAQRIKNRRSSTNRVVCAIPRRRSWALTGTPVENSADDLVGIFEFLSPGLLAEAMSPRSIAQQVQDHILRRTKDQVLDDLPPKLFRDAHVELSADQRDAYDLAESEGVVRLTEMGQSVSVQHVFELVLRLKQICNFDVRTGASSKLERLAVDLEEIAASGKKAIVFSQWVQTLQQIKRRLEHLNPMEYHGKVPIKQREGVIQRFRDDASSHVILMSYGAGSVGLNLQFAGYVFLFDRWWNPAIEDQAINRAHRIGASGPVTVSRFLALNTIEERIDQVLTEKRLLFETMLAQTRGNASHGFSQKDLFGLFNLNGAVTSSRDAA